ncbi:sensor histidine kinase [Dinghuibacter silviterrae]|uniref:histidine kinase n=1 Tax=Dinghuibacter silviterrae TaxID=1539049 RepID=A0A4R8DTA3_9BACT|nr:ATP-binding protein [Dinghuibacter silviterrae]TDX01339.1 histidine kinase/DNA gyrase B/HSP90-like ATPase [Dinghuibacter silviterrae]
MPVPLTVFLRVNLFFCIVCWNIASAQTPTLQNLFRRYEAHKLGDTAYLKAVDSLAPQRLGDDSLPAELSLYQQVAFKKNIPAKYRVRYYRYMAAQAYNKNRLGSAIYYAEKNNEESIRAGIFKAGEIPHSDLFAMAVYSDNWNFAAAFAKYDKLKTRIHGLIGAIPKVSGEELFVAFSILNELASTASHAKDTARAGEAVRVSDSLLAAVDRSPAGYTAYRTFYGSMDHIIRFTVARDRGQNDSALALLEAALADVRKPDYSKNVQAAYAFDFYQDAFDFFITTGNRDSARHYLDLAVSRSAGLFDSSRDKASFVLGSASKLEALSGDYTAAYRDLKKAYEVQDSTVHSISSDKNNNLYALAEAENARSELARKDEEGRRMQQFNILLFFMLVILILVVTLGYFIVASRAKQRMLRLRLGLARNFHDEIGPMLMYAGTLAKKEGEQHPSPRLEELRGHLVHVMEAVRGMTHDLKSSDLSTVVSLAREVTALLEKIKETTTIDFSIKHQNGSRVLSHFQHNHLKKIMNELVSNSIRHSGCSGIQVALQAEGRHLLIRYSDDGKGFDPGQDTQGIGLQNVRERVGLLNGSFRLINEHPAGYAIDLKIPLL